eukprot:1749988-Pleurochrysis_carterae.AAC.8
MFCQRFIATCALLGCFGLDSQRGRATVRECCLQRGTPSRTLCVTTAGIAGAATDNNEGVAGVAGGIEGEPGVSIMTLTVFGKTATDGFAEALVYAADMGAVIASNSWGYTVAGALALPHAALLVLINPLPHRHFLVESVYNHVNHVHHRAIDYFNKYGGGNVSIGGLSVFAAGNEGTSEAHFPAYYNGTIAVAAVSRFVFLNSRRIRSQPEDVWHARVCVLSSCGQHLCSRKFQQLRPVGRHCGAWGGRPFHVHAAQPQGMAASRVVRQAVWHQHGMSAGQWRARAAHLDESRAQTRGLHGLPLLNCSGHPQQISKQGSVLHEADKSG